MRKKPNLKNKEMMTALPILKIKRMHNKKMLKTKTMNPLPSYLMQPKKKKRQMEAKEAEEEIHKNIAGDDDIILTMKYK